MHARAFCENLLGQAGVRLNGPNPWDPCVRDERLFERVAAHGSLGLGEAYAEGWWECAALDQFFERVISARLDRTLKPSLELAALTLGSRLHNRQDRAAVWRAARVHYDLPVEIFEATFDRRLTASCAYWAQAEDLDDAQEAKLDLVCRKLGLGRGARVLDIGFGWGAFMGFAARRCGAECVGVTISKQQADYARQRYEGLKVDFRVEDYRSFDEPVDFIASMGMFEHVGPKNYPSFFKLARRCLNDQGLFVLHTIWANDPRPHIDPWLDKYIFPRGVLPTLREITAAVEGRFIIEDIHNFGADYDRTLMAWNAKFQANRAPIEERFGRAFARTWEYYLLSCAAGFRARGIHVGQIVLSPNGVKGGYRAPR
jgi:cyclopropane-fatty-acyl-phospholipid synthase